MSTAKSSAIVVIPAVILFFILEKNYKAILISIVAYLIFKLPYEILVKTIWSAQNQFSGQSKILLQKDPYNVSEGNEDFIGFLHRFIDNCNLSLSKRFYQILGWRDETNTETFTIITLITVTLILIGFWKIIRNENKEITFILIYCGSTNTFLYNTSNKMGSTKDNLSMHANYFNFNILCNL